MSNPWITEYHSHGWPKQTVINLQVTDGQNGPPFTGKIPLSMRKGDDMATDQPLNFEAEVQNGNWQFGPNSWEQWSLQGFDTLVFDLNGRKIPRTFRTSPTQSQSRSTQQQAPSTPEFQFSAFDKRQPKEIKDGDGKLTGYHLPVFGTLIQVEGKKRQPATQKELEFFRDNIKDGSATTDEHGNFTYTFRSVPPGGHEGDSLIRIQARIKDTTVSSRTLDVDVPFPPKPPEPKVAQVVSRIALQKKSADGKSITYTIEDLIQDQNKKGMGNIPVQWSCKNLEGVEMTCADDARCGWTRHDMEVTEPEATWSYQATCGTVLGNELKLSGPPRQPKPKELRSMIVSKTKVNDKTIRYTIRALVLDEKHSGVGNVHVLWFADDDQAGAMITSNDPVQIGWAEHSLEITKVGGKIQYRATAPTEALLADPIELEGPPPVKTINRLTCDIGTAKDAEGYYRLTINTFSQDNSAGGKFEICSADKFSLKDDGGKVLGTEKNSFPDLETGARGTTAYYLRPEIGDKLQMTVTCKLPTGFSCSQPVANLTLKRKTKENKK